LHDGKMPEIRSQMQTAEPLKVRQIWIRPHVQKCVDTLGVA
jgi:hypothetical protein